ncbi:MAG: nucleotidyltransferase domain-containing protein [Candidatus Hydrogenedentes bacterium]|nr:nucleotidyltransferase domain-containing protein [Candidatus Hydrogenedentota bacterium]
MATEDVIGVVRKFLRRARQAGIPAERAVLYGSFARGDFNEDSDIDVLVIVDDSTSREELDRIWTRLGVLTWGFDTRIEPIPVTNAQFDGGDLSPICYAARTEGISIAA